MHSFQLLDGPVSLSGFLVGRMFETFSSEASAPAVFDGGGGGGDHGREPCFWALLHVILKNFNSYQRILFPLIFRERGEVRERHIYGCLPDGLRIKPTIEVHALDWELKELNP